jgi:hypothetical protein
VLVCSASTLPAAPAGPDLGVARARIMIRRPLISAACSLTADDLRQRQNRWQRLAERAGADTRITADGLQLVFRAAPGIEAELEQLAALERDCCSFATWSIQKRGNQLVLAVSAVSEEGIAAVQAMFPWLSR